MPRRGQLFFLDGLFAGALIIVILLAVFSLHRYMSSSSDRQHERTDLEMRSLYTAALLVETPGHPLNWSGEPIADVNNLGLTTGTPLLLEHEKLSALASLMESNASLVTRLTGFQGSGYAYRLRLIPHGGGTALVTAGSAPDDGAEDVVRIVRHCLYNDTRVAFEFMGWAT